MDTKSELLVKALRKLPQKDVKDFDRHFSDLEDRAYHWPLWGAAFVMQGFFSDDGFMDFRKALISLGRKRYESALANPDSLADLDEVDVEALYTEMWGGFISDALDDQDLTARPYDPRGPSGERPDWDKLKELYPRLSARFK